MTFKTIDLGPTNNANVWLILDRMQRENEGVQMTPSQIRVLLDEHDRLIEKANTTIRELWGVNDLRR